MMGLDPSFLHTATALVVAFVLGTLIGAERQYRQRTAGLRTNVLVAVGSAAFVDLGLRMAGPDGGVRVVSYVVSGIGFLGAGVIMKEGGQVWGLNTAATLWGSAAVGAFAGGRQPGEAVLVAAVVIAGNTLLRPLVDFVNRRPITARETEAVYRVHLFCRPQAVSDARDLLDEALTRHAYPIRDVETVSDAEDIMELAAVLVPTTADPHELDKVVAELETRKDLVLTATWSTSTMT